MSDHELNGIAVPKIYGFTTPEYGDRPWEGKRDGRGLIKIGFTGRDPHVRILEQVQPVKGPSEPEYDLLVVERAFTDEAEVFRDKAVHKELERAGVAHSAGEWYECTKEELLAAIEAVRKGAKLDGLRPKADFEMRPEQRQAVEMTADYFRAHAKDEQPPHFLWNAKMRFGKTFTAYQLAKEMGWNRILVLTYKPAAKTAWREDLEGHKDFEDWRFKDPSDDPTELDLDDDAPLVWFSSFQDALGSDEKGKPKAKNELLHEIDWDCVVVDEFHFGAWRDAARSLYLGQKDELDEGDKSEKSTIESPDLDEDFSRKLEDVVEGKSGLSVGHFLYLSGTPFRALANGDFLEDQIFNWTYSDEQRAKKEWRETKAQWDGGEQNPYESLPTMKMLAYQMPEELKKVALNNQSDFSLSEFFRAAPDEDGEPRFVHENEVQKWLNVLRGQDVTELWAAISNRKSPPLPFENTNLLGTLQHTIWYLPGVDSCLAMAELLGRSNNKFFSDYEVIVAAGKDAGMGAKALDPVEKEIGKQPLDTKTITLTCGKLLTGVTVPAWAGIFMLRELRSPETYFQAAFRVQSPWARTVVDAVEGGEQQEVIKEICFILDFDPNRALTLIGDYAKSLSTDSTADRDDEAAVAEFLEFLPILSFDGYGMKSLEPAEVIDYFTRGITSSMLARRWNSSELITLDLAAMNALLGDPELLESLEGIEMFRNIKEDLTAMISSNKEVEKKKITKEPLTKEERKRENGAKKRRDDLKKRLQRFLTRVPAFMYLTELRESSVKDVITKLEPDLFKRVTALEVSDFQKMLDAGVFNDDKMNEAVWKFREFERPSLAYATVVPAEDLVGGFSVSRSDRFAALIDAELISAGDLLVPTDPALDGVEAEITEDFGIWIGEVRYASPRSAARRVDGTGDYSDDEAMAFWAVKESGKALSELEAAMASGSTRDA